jgi:excisionase family DNA binding protein
MTSATTTQLKEETYVPTEDEAPALANVYDFLEAHQTAGKGRVELRYMLVGAGVADQVEIPHEVHRILLQVITALNKGLAVTIVPQRQKLTTQQAAEVLGITRPTLIRLLNVGKIPFERVGAHRRLFLRDVLDYREHRRQEQYRFLEETAVPLDDEDGIDEILATVREARRKAHDQRGSAPARLAGWW